MSRIGTTFCCDCTVPWHRRLYLCVCSISGESGLFHCQASTKQFVLPTDCNSSALPSSVSRPAVQVRPAFFNLFTGMEPFQPFRLLTEPRAATLGSVRFQMDSNSTFLYLVQ